jgi:plastocyanin
VAWLAAPNNTADWQSSTQVFFPSFTIAVGDTINFILGGNQPSHPFVFCSSTVTTPTTTCALASAVLGTNNGATTAGKVVSYTFTASGTYYYGCHAHAAMGNVINVVTTENICPYYSRLVYGNILSENEASLMTLIVSTAVLGTTTNTPVVPGLLATTSPVLQFFNGSMPYINRAVNDAMYTCNTPPCTINFAADTAAYGILASHLVAFFGTALGCAGSPGFITAAISGLTPSMYDVHKLMGIDNAQMQYFITQILLTVENLTGVNLRAGDGTTVQNFLNGFNRGATDSAEAGMGLPTTTDGQAICTAADCPLGAGATNSPTPAPTPAPNSAPSTSGYSSFPLLISAAFVALVALIF